LADDGVIETSSDRSFGIVFAVVFAIIGLWPFLFGGMVRWWSLAIAAAFLAAALIRPAVLAPLNRLWTKFGLLLNGIVSPLVMGLLFFKMSFLREFWGFMRVRKKFWLMPIFVMMFLFGGLVVLTQGSAVAPFIYTVF
jgi:hypothetical protein